MTTPTASQLWASTSNYRRQGGPGMPDDIEIETESEIVWLYEDDTGLPPMYRGDGRKLMLSTQRAAAILGWHGLMWLVEKRSVPQFDACVGGYSADLMGAIAGSSTTYRAPNMLDAINSAIGAVLDAREGK